MDDCRYSDIINLPHHVSKRHPQMSMRDRAAQFAPFAALTGYEDIIEEAGRFTESQMELADDEKNSLDEVLRQLVSRIAEQPEVSVEYYVADARKSGGQYLSRCGHLTGFSCADRLLVLDNFLTIRIDSIVSIETIV